MISAGVAGGTAIAIAIDVTRTASVESAVRAVEAGLGPVEVVVNNAGWDDPPMKAGGRPAPAGPYLVSSDW
jgi:NAD(P)-dependent dehydrogenase (short-subunit alcohol dehydrogenase family)